MKIIVEILLDEAQLNEEDIKRIEERVVFDVEGSVGNVFWYRENKNSDFEVSARVEP